jgi:hypothetical protein
MERKDNPELQRKMLNSLASKYKINEVREPNHLSSYIGCRTKTFFDQQQAIEPTDQEVMLFAIGYGLQDVLTPKDAKIQVYEFEGVIYSPDMTFEVQIARAELVALLELKTTRKSAKHHYIDEFLPPTWLSYMKGGCKIAGVNKYDLAVLYIMGNYAPPFPQIYCDTFIFTQEEIDTNWKEIMLHKQVLDEALRTGNPPAPFQHCYEWECQYCRYKIMCEQIVKALHLPNPIQERQIQEDLKLWE